MTPEDALAALEAEADPARADQMRAYHKIDRPYLGLSNETCNALAAEWRKSLPLEDRLALADALRALAEAWGHTPAQLALAWLLDQGDGIVPIPGTRSIARLDENAAAVHIRLDDGRRAHIQALLAAHAVAGTRYPAAQMGALNV